MASRIETVREKASGSLEVAVSGGLVFFLDMVDAELLGIAVARGRAGSAAEAANTALQLWPEAELSEEDLRTLTRLDALRRARFYAAQIAARAEQGTRQMYEKLVHKGFEPELARAAVSWMCEAGYIDDVRYVRMLLHAHSVQRGQGLSRVQQIAWQRVGLFESQKRVITEAIGAVEEEDMAQAVRKSAEQMLTRSARAVERSKNQANHGDSRNDPRAEGFPRARQRDTRSALRAHLKRMGFPGHAIDAYLESWENDEIEK